MQVLFFYLFSALAVTSAVMVILLRQPVRALLSLVMVMVSLSGLYLLLQAHFIAMVNIIVYAGAILVVFLFVIMLQGLGERELPLFKRFHPVFLVTAFVFSFVFFGFLLSLVSGHPFGIPDPAQGTIESIGKILFTDYLLPFELSALLLLISIFSAVALAKKEDT